MSTTNSKPESLLVGDEALLDTLESAVENLRSPDRTDACVDAAFRLAFKLEQYAKNVSAAIANRTRLNDLGGVADERAAFEAWQYRADWPIAGMEGQTLEQSFKRSFLHPEKYEHDSHNTAWRVWQARATLNGGAVAGQANATERAPQVGCERCGECRRGNFKNCKNRSESHAPEVVLPAGYAIVPIVPTEAMAHAFQAAQDEWEEGGYDSPDHQWAAMLGAAEMDAPEGFKSASDSAISGAPIEKI